MIVSDTTTPAVVLNAYTHCALGIMRSLGRLGVPVYAVHQTRKAPALRSKYCRGVFELSLEDESPHVALESLARIAGAVGGKPLLIATEDVSCVFVEDHAAFLREHFRFPERPDGLAQALSSKQEMYNLCKRFDVPTPEAVFPTSTEEAVEFARAAAFPLMVKPVDNREVQDLPAAGKAIVSSERELLQLFDRFSSDGPAPKLVLQEYIPGGAESVWMFNGYFDAASECRLAITGQKLRQFPPYVGQTSLGICVPNPVVEETTRRFMRAVGYTGILDIGYRYDARDGTYKLLDVNPRIGAAFRLFEADNELDVARALYLDMTGQPVPEGSAVPGRKWLVENYDLVASLKYHRDGGLSVLDWASSFRGVRASAWFAPEDPRPFAFMSLASAAYLARNRTNAQSAWWKSRSPDQELKARSSEPSVVNGRGQLNGHVVEPSAANR